MFKRRKIKQIFSYRKLLAAIGFLTIIAISYPISKNISQQYKINKEIGDLNKEISDIEKKNQDLNKLMEFLNSDQFIDKQARLNLNYKKDGEEVYVIKSKDADQDISNHDQNLNKNGQAGEISGSGYPNLSKWWKYFIK